MDEKYFISIPVYRFTEEEFYKRVEPLRQRSFQLEHSDWTFFDKYRAYSWEFNEIVGWVRLYFYFSQLQADLWLHKYKRHDWQIWLKRKKFEFKGRLTEIPVDVKIEQPEEITNKVIDSILSSQKTHKPIAQFYLDFDEFRQIGAALHWDKIKISSNHVTQ